MARPHSPRSNSFRKRGLLRAGIVMLVIWAIVTVLVVAIRPDDTYRWIGQVLASQFFVGILFILGVIFLIIGVRGQLKANEFNRADWAMADALAAELEQLWRTPATAAYEQPEDLATVPNARLVEIERHFDQQTEGAIIGTMSHKLKMFGRTFNGTYGRARHNAGGRSSFSSVSLGGFRGSINGLSEVDLGLSSTTRDNLMGDALFSVFEAPGPAGARDTYRVISMSQPGVGSWVTDLVQQVSGQLGGRQTHSGTTVATWAGNLRAQFLPGDISYVTDRLKAISARPSEEREPVTIAGTEAGRNAVLASRIQIAGGEELRLMPSAFPGLLGTAIAHGIAGGERTLNPGASRPELDQG